MARYSYAKYGVSVYGELEANKVSYDSGLEVFQPYYSTVELTWNNTINISTPVPVGEDLTHWKIVKTIGGAPDYPDNSYVVTGGAVQAFDIATGAATIGAIRTTDIESFFPAGSEITYSFWVFNGKDWFFSGSADAIVVTDNNDTTLKLLNYLPGVWSNSTDGYGDVVGVPDENTDIWKYLTNFAFYYDKLRQETAAIDKVSDYRFYPNSLLPAAIRALGFRYEPTLGNNYHRALYKSGNIINSLKGSELGLKIYTSALTHLKNTVVRGNNIMHDYNDSSFEESIGNWAATKTLVITTTALTDNLVTITTSSAHGFVEDDVVDVVVTTNNSIYGGTRIIYSAPTPTTFTYSIVNANITSASNAGTVTSSYSNTSALFTAKKYSTSVADLGLASILTPPTPKLLGQFAPRTEGYGLITSVGTTTGTAGYISLNSYNQIDTKTRTIPITPGEAYHFCGYIQGHTSNVSTTATVQASIVWFTKTGTLISETTLPTATAITTSWSYFDSNEAVGQIYAPITAKYAGVKIYIKNSTNGDRYFIDMLDLCVFPGLVGDVGYVGGENVYEDARVSVVQVEGSRTNYVQNPGFSNGVGSWSATGGTIIPTTESANLGTNACKYVSSVQTGYVYSDWFTFPDDKDFTASAYVKLPPAVKADISVYFSSPKSAVDQTKITSGVFNTTPYSVTSSNAVNLCPNPSFEKDTTFWTFDGAGGSLTRITTDAYVGSACVSVFKSTVANAGLVGSTTLANRIPVTAGLPYMFSAYVKVPTGQPSVSLRLRTQEHQASGTRNPDQVSATTVVTDADGWVRLSFADTPVSGATPTTTMVFEVEETTTAARTFLVDAVLIEQSNTLNPYFENLSNSLNLIPNPSLETDQTGWSSGGGNMTISRSTSFAKYGLNSFKGAVTTTGTNRFMDYFNTDVPVTAGKIYTYSCWVYLPTTNAADISLTLQVHPWTGSAYLAGINLDTETVTRGSWTRFSGTFTAPATTTSALFRVINTASWATGQEMYIDGALLEQTDLLNDYFDNSSGFTRISVSGTSPEYTEDGGNPLVKIGIKIDGLSTNSKTAYIDSVLLEQGSELLPYFQGDLSITSSDVINDPFTAAEDLAWETRLRTNLVPNPSFEAGSITGWTATAGTLTAQTTVAKFGTYSGRIVASGASSNILTTLYYPVLTTATTSPFPAGGESVVGSAYVYGPAGDYTIAIEGGAYTATFSNLAANTWNRIHVVGFATKAAVASPTSTVRVTYAGSTGTWYVDGVQYEFGNSPSPFVDPSDAATTAVANPKDAGKFTWSAWGLLTGSGKSFYWPRATAKFSRLATTLPNYVPLGSDIKVQRGTPTIAYPELPGSLVKSSSFENSLYGWSVREATTAFTREVSSGYPITSSNIGALGGSWAKIINSTTAVTSFGIQQSGINVFGATIYTLSCAAQITDSGDYGVCSIKVEWFDSAGVTISNSTVDKTLGASNVNAWTYVGGSVTSPSNAATATITVYYAPTTRTAGNFIRLDRVLFKAL